MMTLGRFRSLLDAYGAESQRWPGELREDARALLRVSTEARALAEEARVLDAAIATASAEDDASWPSDADEVLGRLRMRVAARIAELPRPLERRPAWRFGVRLDALPWPRRYWVALATAGTFLVIAGFGLGAYATAHVVSPDSDALLTMLQPAPTEILAD